MLVTGISLFAGDPVLFYGTIFFKLKMIMLLAAALNVVVFNFTLGRTPAAVGCAAGDAARRENHRICCRWCCGSAVVACGRGIAYVLPPP